MIIKKVKLNGIARDLECTDIEAKEKIENYPDIYMTVEDYEGKTSRPSRGRPRKEENETEGDES